MKSNQHAFRFITIATILLAISTVNANAQSEQLTTASRPQDLETSRLKVSDETSDKPSSGVARPSESSDVPSDEKADTPRAGKVKLNLFPKPQDAADDGWQFQVTPYLWIAGITGRTGTDNIV